MSVTYKELKKAGEDPNPHRLVVLAIQMCCEFLDTKYLDGGVKHAACAPGREALLEFKQMFEETANRWEEMNRENP